MNLETHRSSIEQDVSKLLGPHQQQQPNYIVVLCQKAEFPASQLHLGGHRQGDGQAEDDQEQGGDRGGDILVSPANQITVSNSSYV